MNGVIRAEVSVVQGTEDNSRGNSDPNEKKPSASIYIKYSPQVNLLERESSIRDLVLRAVPNLKPESISVVMEAADIRFIKAEPNLSATSNTTTSNNTSNTSSNTKETLSLNPPAISDLAPWFIAFALGMGILWAYWIYLQRRRQVKS
ncbi:MAG: hypothetical protein IT497_10215, partial [Ottowia sp.]|nr:hypothetical protein [Ottowia sp.]